MRPLARFRATMPMERIMEKMLDETVAKSETRRAGAAG
jgi:hypothetical protein